MTYKEVEMGSDMHKFELNKSIEGKYTEINKEVGKNSSNVFKVGEYVFWGTAELDILMSKVTIGQQLRITLLDENFKFPTGRTGRHFKVEVDN